MERLCTRVVKVIKNLNVTEGGKADSTGEILGVL